MAGKPTVVQAVYSFKGTNNDELCFKKGDKITITQKEDGGWWEGTLNGKTGWFPSNYVKECKEVAVGSSSTISHQNRVIVLKDLIDSERAHVTELQGLVTNFLQPLEKSGILTSDEYKQLTGNLPEVLDVHEQLLNYLELEETKPHADQKVGKLFLNLAPKIKSVHQTYCSMHPRAVCVLDKYKDELTKHMESCGAASPGVLVLTTNLSKPFRRLDKYSAMLQELERHTEESHVDRGDTQRSVAIYKEIAATCAATRRQKELELQVLTGPVRGWEGQSLTTLGDIIYMGSVAVGPQHHDRYFVLFPTTLLILSVSHRLSAFIYEGKLPLSGINVTRLEDNDQYKNAFELCGPMIEKRIAVCQSSEEANHWVEILKKHMPTDSRTSSFNQKISPVHAQIVPQPPPHLNQRGYCNCTSIVGFCCNLPYTPTYPSSNYPSAAPYASLTRLYRRLVKEKVIHSKLLKQLLYPEYLNKMNLSLVKIRHHKSECVIIPKEAFCRFSIVKCDDDDSDEDERKVKRQDAVERSSSSSGDSSSSSDSSSNPFGYIRYYNPQSGSKTEVETKYESIIDYGEVSIHSEAKMVEEGEKKTSVLLTSTAKLQLQLSESSVEGETGYAFEDLVNLDDNMKLKHFNPGKMFIPSTRQSLPSKFVGDKFSKSSLTSIDIIPNWQSNSIQNLNTTERKTSVLVFDVNNRSSTETTTTTTHSSSIDVPINTLPLPDKLLAELLYNQPFHLTASDSLESAATAISVIKPPTVFASNSFRRHSINSDKPKRLTSSRFTHIEDNLHSPRSSDSGMAGSCTLNSPDSPEKLEEDRLDVACNLDTITLSEIDYNSQCQCSSPFGTPRTSCQTSCTDSMWKVAPKLRSKMTTAAPKALEKSTKCVPNAVRAKSLECVRGDREEDEKKVYKSGLYAHWWLKAKLPQSMSPMTSAGSVRTSSTRSTTTSSSKWSACSLRPAPPLRPCLALGGVQANASRRPTTYKEDATILDVIEVYCMLGLRNTVNSVHFQLTNERDEDSEKSVADTVQVLLKKVKNLEYNLKTISSQLNEERAARCTLQTIVKNHLLNNSKDDCIEWPAMESNILS